MKFLVYRWQAYNQMALEDALINLGHETCTFTCEIDNPEEDAEFEGKLDAYLKEQDYDAVISINYFPVIAKSCNRTGCKYISWTCDSPMLTLYTKSAYLPSNYIFVFDMQAYCEFKARGIISHLPPIQQGMIISYPRFLKRTTTQMFHLLEAFMKRTVMMKWLICLIIYVGILMRL